MPSVSAMVHDLVAEVPADAWQILLVLFLGFLVGLEREGHRAEAPTVVFGGVRTFPIIGLFGYALAKLGGADLLLTGIGFAVVGLLMAVSFNNKLIVARASSGQGAGATSEASALLIYVVGAMVQHGELWIGCTLVVACLLLLEMKGSLERLSARIPHDDVLTFTTFLVLTVVTLPVVPNHDFGPFKLNPFKTWLVVVAVTTISYASYVLQKLLKQGGVLLIAVLGGAYSSTLTTVTLSKKAALGARPHLFSGGILMASGMMYLRLALLVSLFNAALMRALAPAFVALAVAALGAGWLWSRRADPVASEAVDHKEARNPLELSAAFLFALLFLAMLVITQLALTYLGKGGVFSLAAIMGVTDVDPFILGITQSAGVTTPVALGAGAIAIAASSNNAVKGIYAFSFADRRTGTMAIAFLFGLALLGLAPLLWIS